MNEDRELNIAIQKTKAYQQMAETHEFKSFELFDSWVETFLEIYHSSQDSKNIECGDRGFYGKATEMEFQIFAEHFRMPGATHSFVRFGIWYIRTEHCIHQMECRWMQFTAVLSPVIS